jgi:hypothetical protein
VSVDQIIHSMLQRFNLDWNNRTPQAFYTNGLTSPRVVRLPIPELSLPAALVDLHDGQRRKGEVVGQELEPLVGSASK